MAKEKMIAPAVSVTVINSPEEKRSKKAEGGMPDLTGDGKITQADVL